MMSEPADASRPEDSHPSDSAPQESSPQESPSQESDAAATQQENSAQHEHSAGAGSDSAASSAGGGGTEPATAGGAQAPKRRIQVGSRHGLDRPRTLRPQVAGAAKQVAAQKPSPDSPVGDSPRPSTSGQQAESPSTPGQQAATSEASEQPAASPTSEKPGESAAPSEQASSKPGKPEQRGKSAGKPPATGGDVIRAKVPKPSVRDPLTPDLEEELNAALGDMSLDQIMAGEASGDLGQMLELESKHRATVVKVHGDHVFLTLGQQNEGVVSVRQFQEPPEVGAALDVVVKGYDAEEGLYEVGVPGAAIDVSDWSDLVEGAVVEARITGSNTGGLECMVNNIRGFIPASQIAQYRVENFAEFIDQRLPCVVTEANPQRRNLVLSHRAVLEREQEEKRQQLLEELEVGQIRDGTVRNVRDFGAFVDLGGVDGLVHVSQLSWERVNHPSEVVSEGQKVRVKIEKIDPASGKIGLSIRSLQEDPWDRAATDYPVGTTVPGTVSRIANFGAFVRLGPGVEGLVHISELAHHRVSKVSTIVKEGQDVQVKVLSVDREAQRIALSLKATQEAPVQATKAEESEVDEPPRELAVKPQNRGPLKGGTDRPSGGEQFGLNW